MAAATKTGRAPAGVLGTREKLWAAMRELRRFTVSELARAAGVDRSTYCMGDYLRGLVLAGFLDKEQAARGAFVTYTLVRDTGVDAPRVRKDGTLLADTAQERMWRVMKVLRVFSVRDLVVNAALPDAPIADSAARSYCQWLARGKYLAPLSAPGDVQRYRFVRDTGAKAPQILRVKLLYDPNLLKVFRVEDVQAALDAGEPAS